MPRIPKVIGVRQKLGGGAPSAYSILRKRMGTGVKNPNNQRGGIRVQSMKRLEKVFAEMDAMERGEPC